MRTDLIGRYVTFFKSLRKSPYKEVSVLVHIVARDIRTNTGSNLQLIKNSTGFDPWCCSSQQVKIALGEVLVDMASSDQWRLPYLSKLLEERGELHYQGEDTSHLTEPIDYFCIN